MEGAAMLWLPRFPRRTQAQPSAKPRILPLRATMWCRGKARRTSVEQNEPRF